jgi:deoxyribonucleoside regulator
MNHDNEESSGDINKAINSKEDRLGLLFEVASLYYEKRWKKFRIASKLNISPTQVANLLREAQEEGIIRIEVALPYIRSIEQQLVEKFSLKRAIVIPGESQYEVLRKLLGRAAAKYFEENVKDGSKVALSGGTTLFHMVEALEERPRKIEIVPSIITARGPEILHIDPYVLVTLLLIKSNWHVANAYGIVLPPNETGLKGNIEEANKQLRREHDEALRRKEIKVVHEKMKDVDFLFTGSSEITLAGREIVDSPYTYASTLKTLERRGFSKRALIDAGVVGDINYVFINEKGEQMISPYITIGIDMLQRIIKNYPTKQVILIAGGPFKVNALRVILKHRLCNILITDATTAAAILRKERNATSP